jgi:formate/nitrite transporter FocA (FNT family)
MPALFGFDCYAPREIAEPVEDVGVTKAQLPFPSMAALAVLAGGFIGLGAMFFTLVVSDPALGFASARLLGGVAFSLGLILVIVAGAELFTGNNLLVIAWVGRRISTRLQLRNCVIVYLANFVGAAGLAALVALSESRADGQRGHRPDRCFPGGSQVRPAVGRSLLQRGALQCARLPGRLDRMAGRNVADKILAVVFPITAFVACAFEHSVANMYFIPLGMFLRDQAGVFSTTHFDVLQWPGLIRNLIPVTLGNLAGGGGMVGLVYWVIYRRSASAPLPRA